MSTAQVVFAIALGTITVLVMLFALYVISSVIWGDRWIRKGK